MRKRDLGPTETPSLLLSFPAAFALEYGATDIVALVLMGPDREAGALADARAAFIVEACNAYDALRAENERLRALATYLAREDCLCPEFSGSRIPCLSCRAKAALKGGE